MAITVLVAGATMVLQRQAVSASTYSQAILADAPSIYYRLGEASGTTATDSSGNARNGTYNYSQSPGSCCWGLGQSGALANDTDTAAYMDGQRLVYPSGTGLPQGNSAGTFEEWFKTGGTGCAFGLGNSGGNPIFDLCLQSSVSVQITTPNGSPSFATRPVADNNWHLVDVVYGGGSTITLYVDGQPVGTAAGGGFGSPVAFIVGDRTTAAASWSLWAVYDEVAVYNTALTATQVQNHFVASGDSAPTAPGNVTATAGQSSVSVTWSASTAGVPAGATAVTGYIATAYAGTQQAGSIGVGASATGATITGLPAGSAYTVRVTGYNQFGVGTPGTSGAVTPTGASTTYTSTVLQDGPAVYYRLGDSSGNVAADSSGGGHNGIYGYSGAPGACCWSLNQSSALAGDTDASVSLSGYRVVFPYGSGLPQSNGPATLETWIRTQGTGCMLGLGDVNGNPMFNVCLVDQTRVTIATPSLTQWFATKRLTDGGWHLIDAVYDGSSTVSLYIDGQLTGTGSGGGLGASGAFILGDRTNAAGAWALGSSYDEAAVYSSALSADRIAAHFAASADTVPTAPGNVIATAGANQVTVTWSAASATVPSGMSAITGYVATAYAGTTPIASRAAAATASSVTLTGLPSAQGDTVSVVAINAFGSGPAGTSASFSPTGATTTYMSTIRADGATLYYRLGDTGGSIAADSSGQGHLGFYNYTSAPGACCWRLGATGVVPNDADTAAAFDGDRLVWPYGTGMPQGSGARTLEVWFETMSSGCAIGLGDGNGNPMFDACIVGGSQIQLQTPTTSTTFNTAHPLSDGIWHLVDITYDGASTAAVYIDSQLVGTSQAGGMSTPSAFIVGDRTTAAGAYALNATFDEAAVYPAALTATQIVNHYNTVGPIAAPGNVTAVGGPNSAVVHWDAPPGSAAVSSYVVTPFVNGVAQTPTRVDPSLTSVALRNLSASTTYTFQVDAVANGTYGYAASSGSTSSQAPLVIQQPTPLDLGVFVGYSDLRQGGFRPSPWNGDPGIAGGGSDDQGAILLRNPTPNAISASVSIDIGTWHYSAGSGSVPAFGGLILATTDTSDLAGCTYSSNAPQIHVTVNGITVTYGDGGLVLTSGGIDKSNCLNQTEAQSWAQVGGPATTLESLRNPSEMSCHCQSADPVDTATGDYNETATDLSVPGRGVALSAQRQYNSLMSGYNGPFGYGWAFDYGMTLVQEPTVASNLFTVLQENGTPVTFTRQADGSYVPPGRVLATLVRNVDGTYTFTRRARERFVFAADGHLLSESDPNGYTTTLQYSTAGQLTSVTDPTGRSLTLAYDGSGHVHTVTDNAGRLVTYTYDASGNLQQVQDVDGGLTVYGYDSQHLLTSVRDPRGHTMSNTFDAQGRVTQQQDRAQAVTQLAYSNGTTTVTDPLGKATVDTYSNGELVSQTRAYGTAEAATWSYQYDPTTQGVTQITDPNSHITHQTFDVHGNLLSVTDALNRTSTFTYDGLNDVTSVTDPTQEKTTYTYDSAGNLLSASRPLAGTSSSQTVTYSHTDIAHPEDVTALVDPDGKTWHYTYDTHGYLASAADPLGDTSTFTYDGVGRRLTEVTPRGNATGATPSAFTWTWTYDHYGSILSVTDPLGHVTGYQYDANHNLTQVTDPKNQTYASTYDSDDRPISTTRPDATVVKTQYDADGNVSLQQDGLQSSTPSNGTSYAYDHQNRVTGVTDPLGRTTGYGYDGAGNVVSKQDPGGSCTATPQTGCTAYAYDAANQLMGITYSDGTTPNVSNIQYDGDGRRTSMTTGSLASAWHWDSLGRLQQYTNGAGASVGYTYDLAGNVATIAYPGAGTVTRTVDDAGRLKTVADWGPAGQAVHTTTFGYDRSGNLTSEVYPNGVTAAFTYDDSDRMSGLSDATAQNVALFGLSYTRDANGDLTQATPAGVIGTPATYQYDALARLSSATQQSYTYDAADNLTGIGTGSLQYDAANELLSMTPLVGTATTYSYDSRGNRTAAAGGLTATYGYDQASRLTSFSGSGVAAQYAYDGTGLRTSKTVGGVTTPFVWDVNSRIPTLLEDGGIQYIYGANGWPVEEITSGGTAYYLHQDDAGSTRLVTDASATAAQTDAYDGHGNVVASTGSQVTHLLFDGQYTDPETGFQYLRARYYDPSTGQFLSRDPLAALTRHPYLFSAGDPTNGADPTGLSPLDFANGLCDSLLFHACGTAESWFGASANQCSSDYRNGVVTGLGAGVVLAVVSLGTDVAGDAALADEVSGFARPVVSDAKLQNYVTDLYKGEGAPNQIGTGSTADALRNELATGQPTNGVFHMQKAEQYINGLSNWLRKNPNADPDNIWAAQGMLQDLIAAMSGY